MEQSDFENPLESPVETHEQPTQSNDAVKKKEWNSSLDKPENIVNALSEYTDEQMELAAKNLVKEVTNGDIKTKLNERKRNFQTSIKHAAILDKLKPFILAMMKAGYSIVMINERLNHSDGITMPISKGVDDQGKQLWTGKKVVISVPYNQLLNWIKNDPDLKVMIKKRRKNKK